MSEVNMPGDSSEPLRDQLAWDFETATKEGRPAKQAPEVFRALGRRTAIALATSKWPVISSAAVEMAFQSTLTDFRENLSPFAQAHLLEYLVDQMPAQVINYRPGDPYFMATLESFGVNAVFAHITRGVDLSEHEQLSFGMDTDDQPPANSS